MSLDLFLNELRALKVTLAVDGEQLSVRAPKGVITKELGATITARKQEILQLLRPAPGYRNASRVADDCAKLLKDRKSLTPKLGIQGNRGIINTFLI